MRAYLIYVWLASLRISEVDRIPISDQKSDDKRLATCLLSRVLSEVCAGTADCEVATASEAIAVAVVLLLFLKEERK